MIIKVVITKNIGFPSNNFSSIVKEIFCFGICIYYRIYQHNTIFHSGYKLSEDGKRVVKDDK
jgi:hypothetical protein